MQGSSKVTRIAFTVLLSNSFVSMFPFISIIVECWKDAIKVNMVETWINPLVPGIY